MTNFSKFRKFLIQKNIGSRQVMLALWQLTNLYIEVKDQSKINGTPVIQSVKTFFINQIWVPVVVAGGNYKIRSGLSPNLYLT